MFIPSRYELPCYNSYQRNVFIIIKAGNIKYFFVVAIWIEIYRYIPACEKCYCWNELTGVLSFENEEKWIYLVAL